MDFYSQISAQRKSIAGFQKKIGDITNQKETQEEASDKRVGRGLDYLEAGIYGKQTTDAIGKSLKKVSKGGLDKLNMSATAKSDTARGARQVRGDTSLPNPPVEESVDSLRARGRAVGQRQVDINTGASRSLQVGEGLVDKPRVIHEGMDLSEPEAATYGEVKEGIKAIKSKVGEVADTIGEKTGYTAAKKFVSEGADKMGAAVADTVGEGALETLGAVGGAISGVGEVAATGAALYGGYELGKEGVDAFEDWYSKRHHKAGGLNDTQRIDLNKDKIKSAQQQIARANTGLSAESSSGAALQSRAIQSAQQQSAVSVS